VNSFIVIISTRFVHLCYSIDQQNILFEGISKYSLVTCLGVLKKKNVTQQMTTHPHGLSPYDVIVATPL
jgi:hypothetical protein